MIDQDELTYVHRLQHVPKELDAGTNEANWERVVEGLAGLGVGVDSSSRLHLLGENRFRWLTSTAAALRATAQTISTGSFTVIALTSEGWDTDSLHDNSSDNNRVNINVTGKYLVVAQVIWDTSVLGTIRSTLVRDSSTATIVQNTQAVVGTDIVTAIQLETLAAGNWLEMLAYQDTGVDLDATFCSLRVVYVGE